MKESNELLIFVRSMLFQTKYSICIGTGALAVEILTWVVLDNTLLAKHARYLLTPYFVLIWALVGIVHKIWDEEKPIALFAGAVLMLAVGM